MKRHFSMYSLAVAAATTAAVASLNPTNLRADSLRPGPTPTAREKTMSTATQTQPDVQTHPYVGMWVTQDGYIRHELLPNNRYDEARGKVKSAYQGRYRMTGNHIDYWDDTGFTADGEFRDGILYHAGMVLFRER
jgi:hypothetical protein